MKKIIGNFKDVLKYEKQGYIFMKEEKSFFTNRTVYALEKGHKKLMIYEPITADKM